MTLTLTLFALSTATLLYGFYLWSPRVAVVAAGLILFVVAAMSMPTGGGRR